MVGWQARDRIAKAKDEEERHSTDGDIPVKVQLAWGFSKRLDLPRLRELP